VRRNLHHDILLSLFRSHEWWVLGPIDTVLFRDGKPEQLITAIANTHPSKRIGTVGDIAPVVAFLASPEAAWVNGQNILINGVSI